MVIRNNETAKAPLVLLCSALLWSQGDTDGDVFVPNSQSPRHLFLYIPNLPSFTLHLFIYYYWIFHLHVPSHCTSLHFLHQPFNLPFSLDPTFLSFPRFLFSFLKKLNLGFLSNSILSACYQGSLCSFIIYFF
ncbi:hypothetical protein GQ457_10G003170 [Hibiscus cannabinus]